MAKKIFKGVGKVLGIGGKKKAAAPEAATAAPAEQKGPIVTPLTGTLLADARRRTRRSGAFSPPTILSDRLGA